MTSISCRLGRYPIMMLTTSTHLVFAIMVAYTDDYWSFTWLRFAVAFTSHSASLCGFVIS